MRQAEIIITNGNSRVPEELGIHSYLSRATLLPRMIARFQLRFVFCVVLDAPLSH